MFGDFLTKNGIKSAAKYVEYGYGQVEPNHLSAQYNGQIYAQLPAAANITKLEQGQFVKYDYAKGVVDFEGFGEWMLVYNEIKLYRDNQMDCEFAMLKDNYEARVYSPFGGAKDGGVDTVNFNGQGRKQSRYYNGEDSQGNNEYTMKPAEYVAASGNFDATATYYTYDSATGEYAQVETPVEANLSTYFEKVADAVTYAYDDVTAGPDMYEPYYNEDPFHIEGAYKEAMMPEGTKMVPRVFKTMVGDIYTTNTIDELPADITLGALLTPRAADGILVKANNQNALPADGSMIWQVVKVYTMPDHQRGVKLQRVQ